MYALCITPHSQHRITVVNRGPVYFSKSNSPARLVAFTTALMSVTRSLPSSNSMIPSMVHPAGVVTAFQNHTRCALHGLRREQSGYVARQTHFDAGFGERFENNVGKRRTACG